MTSSIRNSSSLQGFSQKLAHQPTSCQCLSRVNDQPNPYRPPTESNDVSQPVAARRIALWQIRIALAILLLPGIHNYLCVDQALRTPQAERGFELAPMWREFNLACITLLAIVIWFAGLSLLEFAARVLHRCLSRRIEDSTWLTVLYTALAKASYFALAGAILWFLWNIGYFYLKLPYLALAIPLGAAAHLLAAGLYLPLLYRWYRLLRSTPES